MTKAQMVAQSTSQLPMTSSMQMASNQGILNSSSQGQFQKLSKKQMQQILAQGNSKGQYGSKAPAQTLGTQSQAVLG